MKGKTRIRALEGWEMAQWAVDRGVARCREPGGTFLVHHAIASKRSPILPALVLHGPGSQSRGALDARLETAT
jgi:hypothetical protein